MQKPKVRIWKGPKKQKRVHYFKLWAPVNRWYMELILGYAQIIAGAMHSLNLSAAKVEEMCETVTVNGRKTKSRYPTATTILRVYRVGTGEEAPYFINHFVLEKILMALGCKPQEAFDTVVQTMKEEHGARATNQFLKAVGKPTAAKKRRA